MLPGAPRGAVRSIVKHRVAGETSGERPEVYEPRCPIAPPREIRVALRDIRGQRMRPAHPTPPRLADRRQLVQSRHRRRGDRFSRRAAGLKPLIAAIDNIAGDEHEDRGVYLERAGRS